MAFDQNMIIDATTGSIARFVNHSCNPNCRMEKWIVHGQPRMALFAGDRPIMTGEELTYDYNFDPFSAKNVQKCLCGSANCRGVLGPKVSRIPKAEAKNLIKETMKAATKAGKRKLKELLGEEQTEGGSAKKRKVAKATGAKKSLGAKASAVVKKTASSISVNARALKGNEKKPVSVSVRKATLVKASKTLIKNGKQILLADSIGPQAASTIVAKSTTKTKAVAKGSAKAPAAKASSAAAAKAKTKAKAKGATKASGKAPVKATIKSAGVKGSIKSTIKSAKHTINKTAGKKTAKKTTKTTTTVTKKSILASPDSAKVTKKYGKKDRSLAAMGGSISVKSPRKALDLSREPDKITVVQDAE